jgi:hypothetical protein
MERRRYLIRAARCLADDEAYPALSWDERMEIVGALGRALRLIEQATVVVAVMENEGR